MKNLIHILKLFGDKYLTIFFWRLKKSDLNSLNEVCYYMMHGTSIVGQRESNYLATREILLDYVSMLNSNTYYFDSMQESQRFLEDELKIQLFQNRWIHNQTIHTFPTWIGEIGIYCTFIQAARNFLRTKYKYLVIMEDDNKVTSSFPKILAKIVNRAPTYWDVINLNPASEVNYSPNLLNLTPLSKAYSSSNTGCFLLNRESANRILSDLEKNGVLAPLDWYLFNGYRYSDIKITNFESYEIKPWIPKLVSSLEIESSIRT